MDLAILDINMPQIDGITLAARIKQISPQTAILFLTAYKEYAFDAYAVHPTGYLLKPVTYADFASIINEALAPAEAEPPKKLLIKT